MELTLNWTESSRNELLKLFFYYKHQSNLKTARNKIEKISKQVLLLKKTAIYRTERRIVDWRKRRISLFVVL